MVNYTLKWASLMAQMVKNLPEIQETWAQSLGREDPPEEEMATNTSILAWTVPWTEKPGGLQSMGSQRVGHNLGTEHTRTPISNKIKIISPFILNNKFTCLIVKQLSSLITTIFAYIPFSTVYLRLQYYDQKQIRVVIFPE